LKKGTPAGPGGATIKGGEKPENRQTPLEASLDARQGAVEEERQGEGDLG